LQWYDWKIRQFQIPAAMRLVAAYLYHWIHRTAITYEVSVDRNHAVADAPKDYVQSETNLKNEQRRYVILYRGGNWSGHTNDIPRVNA
jgi:hypothetical protein